MNGVFFVVSGYLLVTFHSQYTMKTIAWMFLWKLCCQHNERQNEQIFCWRWNDNAVWKVLKYSTLLSQNWIFSYKDYTSVNTSTQYQFAHLLPTWTQVFPDLPPYNNNFYSFLLILWEEKVRKKANDCRSHNLLYNIRLYYNDTIWKRPRFCFFNNAAAFAIKSLLSSSSMHPATVRHVFFQWHIFQYTLSLW